MVNLSILRFMQSVFREASTFTSKEGKEINVPQHFLADVQFADKVYSKIAKAQIIKLGNKEVKADCELPPAGDWLCEIEQRGDDYKVVRVLGKADLNTLLVKQTVNNPKKEAKGELL